MASRSHRAAIAQETVHIMKTGGYTAPDGTAIDIGGALNRAKAGTVVYRPDDFAALKTSNPSAATEFEVTNETTLSAAARLLAAGADRVLALNFASAKNPGGG